MDWLSLLLPFAYITILTTSLFTFSHLYRRRQAAAALSLTPWFPPHLTRQIYLSLLELQSSPSTKVPDSVLRAALLRRATTDIHRILSLRSSKPALAQLLQRGSVGDDLWQRFQMAEKEMELELREVVEEANALAQGWGQLIFQSASECAHNELLRKKLKGIEESRKEEKDAWERTKTNVREGFMKELDAEELAGAEGITGKAKEENVSDKSIKTGSSDEEAVMVEKDTTTPDTPTSIQQDGGGSAKKKKGKK